MGKIEASIEVNVPISTAYNQWTQFEEFPRFMEGIESVKQIDDRTLEWYANIAGNDETWTAEITEQEPDKRISWRSTSGTRARRLGPDSVCESNDSWGLAPGPSLRPERSSRRQLTRPGSQAADELHL